MRKALYFACLLASVAGAELRPSDLPAGPHWKLVWSDEFEGTELDRSKWDYRLHIFGTRHQTFTNAGVTVSDGCCHLKVIEQGGQYYSPQLQTGNNLFDFPRVETRPDGGMTWPIPAIPTNRFVHRYGYWECRCRTQRKPGWWSAFWIQSPFIGASKDPALTGAEMDVMESFSTNTIRCGNVGIGGYGPDNHWWGAWTSRKMPIDRPTPMNDRFHTYGVWWTPTNVTFYIDGGAIGTLDKPGWISHVPEFLLISTECNGYREGTRKRPSPELKPDVVGDEFTVDYVRVFDEVH